MMDVTEDETVSGVTFHMMILEGGCCSVVGGLYTMYVMDVSDPQHWKYYINKYWSDIMWEILLYGQKQLLAFPPGASVSTIFIF